MKSRKMKKIIDNIENYTPTEEDMNIIGNLADKYLDKSEDDIFVEIIRVKSEMEDQISEEQYNAIFEKLDAIRPMLDEEQNRKLDKVLELLEKNK